MTSNVLSMTANRCVHELAWIVPIIATCSTESLGPFWSHWFAARAPPPRGAATAKVLSYGNMGASSRHSPRSAHHWEQTMLVTVFDVVVLYASGGDYDAVWHTGMLTHMMTRSNY